VQKWLRKIGDPFAKATMFVWAELVSISCQLSLNECMTVESEVVWSFFSRKGVEWDTS